jgi:hypothetical protein
VYFDKARGKQRKEAKVRAEHKGELNTDETFFLSFSLFGFYGLQKYRVLKTTMDTMFPSTTRAPMMKRKSLILARGLTFSLYR